MRPYLAILKDAFTEALASRVLWVLLLITGAVLIALAGFTLDERAGASFAGNELLDPKTLAKLWRDQAAAPRPSPGKRIWEQLNEPPRQHLEELLAADAATDKFVEPVQAALNRLLTQRELYDAASWPAARLDPEGYELLSTGPEQLSSAELMRFHRLLLEATYPRLLAPSRERELYVSFYGLEIPTGAMPLLRREYLIKTAVGLISGFFLGFLGLFAGLIVTSSVIPQTFEPGAVDLLLSKPVRRVGVYLTKFLGGCMFVLLNTTMLLGGLFLLVGLRHGIWMGTLPLCVPIFLFWFMVFYAVSALIGLWSRNAIVAVTLTICLWGVCSLLSFVKNGIIEGTILDPERLSQIVERGGELVATAENGQVFRWNDEAAHWDEIVLPDNPRRFRAGGSGIDAGPLLAGDGKQVLAVQRSGRRWNSWLGAGSPLVYGNANEQFRRHESSASAPLGTALLAQDRVGRIIAAGLGGISMLPGPVEAPAATPSGNGPKLFGVELKLPNLGRAATDQFELISPPQNWIAPLAAAHDPRTDRIVVFQRGQLQIFDRAADSRYREAHSRKIPGREYGLAAIAGDTALLAFDDGGLQEFTGKLWQPGRAHTPVPGVPARSLHTSPDGKTIAALFHDRSVWLYDVVSAAWSRAPLAGQGDFSAVNWTANGDLWAVDRWQRATLYAANDDFRVVREAANAPHWLELFDVYFLKPLYAILPKPGETGNLVNFLLTDQRTFLTGQITGGLRSPRTPIDIWSPLVTHAIFLAAMLAWGCWIIQRRDY